MKNGFGRRWALGLGLAMVACVGLGAWASRATAGGAMTIAPPNITRVATVNLEELFPLMKEREDKLKVLQAKQTEYKNKVDALEAEIKNDVEKLKAEPDGPNKLAMAKALREKKFRFDFEGKYAINLLAEMEGEMFRDLYLKIAAAVRVVAKRDGYNLVMASDEKVAVNAGDPETVQRAISFKRMLYVDPELDITQDIATYVNLQYATGSPSPKKTP